ncbi:MAG: M15 family metallopeptidase [Oscillospiraceae bacterium]|nr:M15 family metallopeptidase [Oscillospiraceae bacterium]
MRDVFREDKAKKKQRKGGIILTGIKYLLLATVLMFAIVFFVTRFGRSELPENELPGEEITILSDSEAVPAGNNAEEDEVDMSIDNAWAMFLVNDQNPLPDNYDSVIQTAIVFEDYRQYFMDARAADYVISMFEDAQKDGIELYMVSAYRDIAYQQNVFNSSVQERVNGGMSYEEAYADTAKHVAIPGRSEHNAGLAADIMSRSNTDMSDDSFKDTPEFAWLQENASNYGFILRYPEDKTDVTGIIFEPWHYRFVGVYYARELTRLGLTMEEYYEHNGWLDENGTATHMYALATEAPPPDLALEADTDLNGEPAASEPPAAPETARQPQSVTIVV